MRSKAATWTLLLLAAAGGIASECQAQYKVRDRICIADVRKAPPVLPANPIPIGCELVDCCPGCPGGGQIEWRVSIEGKILSGAEIALQGLSAEQLGRVKAQRGRVDQGRLQLRPGVTTIQGLPRSSGERSPVAALRPIFDPRVAADLPPGQNQPAGQIVVQQLLDNVVINNFDWKIFIRPCERPPVPPLPRHDIVKIDGLQAGEQAIVMLDVRKTGGCHDGSAGAGSEWVFPSTGVTLHENLLPQGACPNSEVAVFSKNHFMQLEPITTWTNALGDLHTVTLQPLKDVAVHIWVFDDANPTVAQQRVDTAQQHIDLATQIYGDQRAGVRFVPTIRKVASSDQQTVRNGINSNGTTCLNVATFNGTGFYTPNTLNVYYVDKTFRGKNCAIAPSPPLCTSDATTYPPGDANITFIGTTAATTSLAHEIGHAFGLRPAACDGHTENRTDIATDNLMNALGADERKTLTLGQIFRMYTHDDAWGGSMLLKNNIPGGVGRSCVPNVYGATCPELSVDWP